MLQIWECVQILVVFCGLKDFLVADNLLVSNTLKIAVRQRRRKWGHMSELSYSALDRSSYFLLRCLNKAAFRSHECVLVGFFIVGRLHNGRVGGETVDGACPHHRPRLSRSIVYVKVQEMMMMMLPTKNCFLV